MTEPAARQRISLEKGYFRVLFDAVPSPILIVDDDVRILDYNLAGAGVIGPNPQFQYMKHGGEALHCIHADETPKGCGGSADCGSCIVRNSVSEALRVGEVRRLRTNMRLRRKPEETPKEVTLLVTAAPLTHEGRRLVLLLLEDVSELMQLRKILPICSYCRKIRNDENYWKSVEEYFLDHQNLLFSHSICESCMREQFPKIPLPGIIRSRHGSDSTPPEQ